MWEMLLSLLFEIHYALKYIKTPEKSSGEFFICIFAFVFSQLIWPWDHILDHFFFFYILKNSIPQYTFQENVGACRHLPFPY